MKFVAVTVMVGLVVASPVVQDGPDRFIQGDVPRRLEDGSERYITDTELHDYGGRYIDATGPHMGSPSGTSVAPAPTETPATTEPNAVDAAQSTTTAPTSSAGSESTVPTSTSEPATTTATSGTSESSAPTSASTAPTSASSSTSESSAPTSATTPTSSDTLTTQSSDATAPSQNPVKPAGSETSPPTSSTDSATSSTSTQSTTAPTSSSSNGTSASGGEFSGDGTYYTAGHGEGGACGIVSSGTNVVAMNSAQFSKSSSCGQCVQITGARGTQKAQVVDLCPPCAHGSLDLSETLFPLIDDPDKGRVPISWSFVDC